MEPQFPHQQNEDYHKSSAYNADYCEEIRSSEFESMLKTGSCYADKCMGLRALEDVHHVYRVSLCSQCLKVNNRAKKH